jgi:hypothetical protein
MMYSAQSQPFSPGEKSLLTIRNLARWLTAGLALYHTRATYQLGVRGPVPVGIRRRDWAVVFGRDAGGSSCAPSLIKCSETKTL